MRLTINVPAFKKIKQVLDKFAPQALYQDRTYTLDNEEVKQAVCRCISEFTEEELEGFCQFMCDFGN